MASLLKENLTCRLPYMTGKQCSIWILQLQHARQLRGVSNWKVVASTKQRHSCHVRRFKFHNNVMLHWIYANMRVRCTKQLHPPQYSWFSTGTKEAFLYITKPKSFKSFFRCKYCFIPEHDASFQKDSVSALNSNTFHTKESKESFFPDYCRLPSLLCLIKSNLHVTWNRNRLYRRWSFNIRFR